LLRVNTLLCTHLYSSFSSFFTDPAPPTIYPLSLHDALPISDRGCAPASPRPGIPRPADARYPGRSASPPRPSRPGSDNATTHDRSEEHTSELQSRENLVCRLLLEKKKKDIKSNDRIDRFAHI